MKRLLSSLIKPSFCLLVMVLIAGGMLRFFRLGQVPLGYTFDEVAIAYDAWSLAEWGVDIFMRPYPKVFESLGDYKAPLMIYLLSGIYRLTGFQLVAVRWVSAAAGVISLLTVYGIGRELFSDRRVGLAAAGLMALSPWSLQLSRTGFEANLGLALVLLGMYFFLMGKKKAWFYPVSGLFWGLSLTAYHAPKIVVPLLLVWLWWFRPPPRKQWPFVGVMLAVIGWSYWEFLVSLGPTALQRGRQTSILYTPSGAPAAIDQVAALMGRNVFAHLSPGWWMGGVQATMRQIVPGYGVLLGATFVLVIWGFGQLWRHRRNSLYWLLGCLLIGLVPSVISRNAPHALRAAFSLPVLLLVAGYGFIDGLKRLQVRAAKWVYVIGIGLAAGYIGQYAGYLWSYYTVYPWQSARAHQYGYFTAIEKAEAVRDEGDTLAVTTANGDPKYHMLIYLGISPPDFHAGAMRYATFAPIKWPNQERERVYIATPEEIPPEDDRVVDSVTIPTSNEIVYVIAKK